MHECVRDDLTKLSSRPVIAWLFDHAEMDARVNAYAMM
jgi:hypothetical protein